MGDGEIAGRLAQVLKGLGLAAFLTLGTAKGCFETEGVDVTLWRIDFEEAAKERHNAVFGGPFISPATTGRKIMGDDLDGTMGARPPPVRHMLALGERLPHQRARR